MTPQETTLFSIQLSRKPAFFTRHDVTLIGLDVFAGDREEAIRTHPEVIE